MKLLLTGVSHKTAPVEVRECLAFREETLPAALADLKSRLGPSSLVGCSARAMEALNPEGHVLVEGEIWSAVSTEAVPAGAPLRVMGLDKYLLHVEPAAPQSPPQTLSK